ncbi:MAG: dienelactone hydrolase family protein [Hyphomicrobium sp.]
MSDYDESSADANVAAHLKSLRPRTSLSRRDAMVATLASSFALATQPIAAETQIKTDAEALEAGEIRIKTADVELPAYRAMPASGGPFPIVLVVQEIFGVHEYIRDVCRRLAKLGYIAIAPELYVRQGDVSNLKSIDEIRVIVAKVPDAQVMSDLDAAVAYAKDSGKGDAARLAITGFCWGGRVTWLYTAHNPDVKAGAAWYGRLVGEANALTPSHPVDVAAKLNAPVLGLYGGADDGIPLETIEKMRAACATANKTSEIKVYEGVPHAFHADYRPSYRPDAAKDGWAKMLAWFKQNGVG